ncbi:MAG: hypothetical protein PWQ31_1259 [Eubacteriales bacterium]|nr:hypothetical protein [Eubacteriales bacterium]
MKKRTAVLLLALMLVMLPLAAGCSQEKGKTEKQTVTQVQQEERTEVKQKDTATDPEQAAVEQELDNLDKELNRLDDGELDAELNSFN